MTRSLSADLRGRVIAAIEEGLSTREVARRVKAYAAGNYMADIDGVNQAQVMRAMETHLGGQDWKKLQMKVRIAPITTIPDDGTDPLQIVQADIGRIHDQLDQGWAILGWQNQTTVHQKDHPYAIGGGVAGMLPPAVERAIQDGLKSLAGEYQAQR